MAAAGGDIDIDFRNSKGTYKFGSDEIELKPCIGGIGFWSRKPTAEESRTVKRIIISTSNYNKATFMQEGNQHLSKTNISKIKGKNYAFN
jgi:hypothetical protein